MRNQGKQGRSGEESDTNAEIIFFNDLLSLSMNYADLISVSSLSR